jgi:hypothetical protein
MVKKHFAVHSLPCTRKKSHGKDEFSDKVLGSSSVDEAAPDLLRLARVVSHPRSVRPTGPVWDSGGRNTLDVLSPC